MSESCFLCSLGTTAGRVSGILGRSAFGGSSGWEGGSGAAQQPHSQSGSRPGSPVKACF
jgi:hypothetical protein